MYWCIDVFESLAYYPQLVKNALGSIIVGYCPIPYNSLTAVLLKQNHLEILYKETNKYEVPHELSIEAFVNVSSDQFKIPDRITFFSI